jgi:hypothetical protein
MALGQGKRAIGVFPNRQDTESALNELKNSDFLMDKVSVVARDVSENDEMAESESQFVREQTLKGIGTGAICASQHRFQSKLISSVCFHVFCNYEYRLA